MNPINRLHSANNRDLSQQDGWKTPDGRMTKNCRARPGMHSLAWHFFYSQVWALHCSPFRDQRREVAKMCGVSVLEIFHPYSVENLRDNVNLWWLQDKSHLLDLKMRKLYMKWTLYCTVSYDPRWSPDFFRLLYAIAKIASITKRIIAYKICKASFFATWNNFGDLCVCLYKIGIIAASLIYFLTNDPIIYMTSCFQ